MYECLLPSGPALPDGSDDHCLPRHDQGVLSQQGMGLHAGPREQAAAGLQHTATAHHQRIQPEDPSRVDMRYQGSVIHSFKTLV